MQFIPKKISLSAQIFIALISGIIAGFICHTAGLSEFTTNYLKPLGDIFVNLLKFVVVPVVLLSMIDGILSMNDLKKVKAVGFKTLMYFIFTTAIACVIGLVFANIFHNAGFFPVLNPEGVTYEAKEFAGIMPTLVAIFPSNMWQSFFNANMLQIIVISILFGGAIMSAGERGNPARTFVKTAYAVIEQLMNFIIGLAPIGVFTYIAWIVATMGSEILTSLVFVILCVYIGYIVHTVFIYSFTAKFLGGVSPIKFFKEASPAMIFGFSSACSLATLPVSRECSKKLNIPDDIASFVLPLGSTIHMDGTAIYQCVLTVFVASCAGLNLTVGQMVVTVATAILSSIGTAGVSGAGTIMLAMILETLGIPVSYIGIVVAIDRVCDMGRTCLNVTGDIACALCVTKWEGSK